MSSKYMEYEREAEVKMPQERYKSKYYKVHVIKRPKIYAGRQDCWEKSEIMHSRRENVGTNNDDNKFLGRMSKVHFNTVPSSMQSVTVSDHWSKQNLQKKEEIKVDWGRWHPSSCNHFQRWSVAKNRSASRDKHSGKKVYYEFNKFSMCL